MWKRAWHVWVSEWNEIEKNERNTSKNTKNVLKTKTVLISSFIFPRKIHSLNYKLVCAADRRQIKWYALCVKVCVCVLMIYLSWLGLCFQFGGCQSSGWWSVRAGSLMYVERAGSIGAQLWFYKDPAMPLSSATRKHTHAKMSHTNMHSTPHAVRAWRGPHAYVPPSHLSVYFWKENRRLSKMTWN